MYSRKDKEEEYVLMASSLNEMEDWLVTLFLMGATLDKDKVPNTTNENPPNVLNSVSPDTIPHVMPLQTSTK